MLDHALFEVGWVSSDARSGSQDSLIALDPTGQVVTIEVHDLLDSAGLLAALARAGRHSDLTRARIAALFGGESAFTTEFQNFIDTTPPVTRGGPRLFLFAREVAEDVLAPLAALGGQGVEANRIVLHDGANGLLVELAKIVREPRGILAPARNVVQVESAPSAPASSQNEEMDASSPWNITGWNSADVPRPPRYTPPVKEKPLSEEENPVLAAMEKEAPKDVPEMDPEELAQYAAEESGDERTDTAIMLAELSQSRPVEGEAHTAPASSVADGTDDAATAGSERDELGYTEEIPAGPQLEALMYEEARRAALRPEQRLWDDAAPATGEHQIFDEGASARHAEEAVARAAVKHPHGWRHALHGDDASQAPEGDSHELLAQIAQKVGAPVNVRWFSRRRGIDVAMQLTEQGTLRGEDGAEYATPQAAADAVGAGKYRNAWLVWRLESGERLADFL